MGYDNNQKGALFKNERKTRDTHPDYTGTAVVEGCEYWLSAWINRAKNGKMYMSLSFTEKEPAKPAPSRSTGPSDDFDPDDDIPF